MEGGVAVARQCRDPPLSRAQVCLLRCTLLSSLLLLLACRVVGVGGNSGAGAGRADTQMQHPGRVSFTFIEKMQLDDPVCYVKAAFPLLGELLAKTEFKENSSNGRRLQMVRRMYGRIDENVDPCIREEDDEERQLSQKCSREFTTSPYEMLALVKQFFHDLNLLLQAKETFEKDCSRVYRERCPAPTGSSPPGETLGLRRRGGSAARGSRREGGFVDGTWAGWVPMWGGEALGTPPNLAPHCLPPPNAAVTPPPCRALQGAQGCAELEMQQL
uniref:CSF1 factor n=1 Tax=Dromaius novaehollandiae TaxID=8790 RepID=A0A8C4KIC2_DRONO